MSGCSKCIEPDFFDVSQTFPPRIERGTCGLEIRCSIQLSYGNFISLTHLMLTDRPSLDNVALFAHVLRQGYVSRNNDPLRVWRARVSVAPALTRFRDRRTRDRISGRFAILLARLRSCSSRFHSRRISETFRPVFPKMRFFIASPQVIKRRLIYSGYLVGDWMQSYKA